MLNWSTLNMLQYVSIYDNLKCMNNHTKLCEQYYGMLKPARKYYTCAVEAIMLEGPLM